MPTQKIKKSERKLLLKKTYKIAWLYLLLYFLAFISFIFSGQQYETTIIPFKNIIAIHLVVGLVLGVLTYKNSEILDGDKFNPFQHFFLAVLIYGELVCSLFYITNRQFATKQESTIKFRITERHNAYRRSPKYVTVYNSGFEKDIYFPNTDMLEINHANSVLLTISKGFWGFPVIKQKVLSESL